MGKVSVALTTHNSGDLIEQCLESVRWADQVVVVDGMSTDDTARRCAAFPRVRFISVPNNPNLDVNKNIAIDHCTGDWILCLDSDEVVTPALAGEILRMARDGENGKAGFFIPRRNLFLGRWMRASGWHPDHVLRFFRRGRGRFPCVHVHERLDLDGDAGCLEGELQHYTYRSFREYFEKMERYTNFEAEYLLQLSHDTQKMRFRDFLWNGSKRKPYLRRLWWKYMPAKPLFRFLLIYVVRRGFLDGREGFTLAVLSAVSDHVSIEKYRALKEATERRKKTGND